MTRVAKNSTALLFLTLSCLFSGCTEDGEEEVEDSDVTSESAPVAAQTPTPETAGPVHTQKRIGFIETFIPRVTVRRKRELVWKDAVPEISLFEYDAVHTHESATAKLALNNGSELNMKPNTLIILNPSILGPTTVRDRAVVRDGQIDGKTKGELWIMTSAALLKIKSKGGKKAAEASVVLKEGKALTVSLKSGEGVIMQTENKNGKPITLSVPLKRFRTVTLPAPAAPSDFGKDLIEANWTEGPRVASTEALAKNIARKEPARTVAAKMPAVTMTITSPRPYSEVTSPSVWVTGRLSGSPMELKINGQKVKPDAKFEFGHSVPLKLGANNILVELINEGEEAVNHRFIVNRRQ